MAKKKTTKKKPRKKKIVKRVAKKATKKRVTKKNKSKKKTTKKTTRKKVAVKKVAKKKTIKKNSSVNNTAKKKTVKKIRRRRGVSVSDAARESKADEHGYVFVNGRIVRMISTNGVSKKKKRSTKTKATIVATKQINIKTHLTAKQLRAFRDRLFKYRAQLLVDLGAIEKEALDANTDISHMPIHMADVGSDAYDQDLKLGMAASERKRIRDIEEALMRIRKKTYGVCHLTGDTIPDARLRAKPWAKYTKEAAEKIERRTRQRR